VCAGVGLDAYLRRYEEDVSGMVTMEGFGQLDSREHENSVYEGIIDWRRIIGTGAFRGSSGFSSIGAPSESWARGTMRVWLKGVSAALEWRVH
jgi:hypothetical protein